MTKPSTWPNPRSGLKTAEPIWNREAALANAGNDNGVADLIRAEFLRTLPDSESALTHACQQSDLDGLSKHVHRLAGAAALVGADTVRSGCLALSRLLKTVPKPDTDPLVLQVDAILRETARFREAAEAVPTETKD